MAARAAVKVVVAKAAVVVKAAAATAAAVEVEDEVKATVEDGQAAHQEIHREAGGPMRRVVANKFAQFKRLDWQWFSRFCHVGDSAAISQPHS